MPWGLGLRGLIEAERGPVDVAHLHGHRSPLVLIGCRALEARGIPWVLQPHGTFPHHGHHRLLKHLVDRLGGRRAVVSARRLLATSDSEARDLPGRPEVVPNGVEPVGRSGRRPRTSEAGRALLFVGSDHPQKRCQALPRLLRAVPEARLLLVGRIGPERLRELDSFAPRVTALGVLEGDRLAETYASADLLVHPAVNESFGLVPFEAALHGTPAVVAGGHGCGEFFGRAGGCIVPPDDALALADAVRTRLATPSLGQREAASVAAFARAELTWSRAAEKTETIYLQVVRDRTGCHAT